MPRRQNVREPERFARGLTQQLPCTVTTGDPRPCAVPAPLPQHGQTTQVMETILTSGNNPAAAPQWQTHLQGLPAYKSGGLTPKGRELYSEALVSAGRDGGSMHEIAAFLGCPRWVVTAFLDLANEGGPPACRRVADILRSRIDNGTYRVGDVLLTRGQMSKHFGVSIPTVSRALAQLDVAGRTLAFPARGTVVIDPHAPIAGPTLQVRMPWGKTETWHLPNALGPHIRAVITERIKNGTYPEGSTIPGLHALIREFGGTFGMTAAAVNALRRQGLVATATPAASGTIVVPGARSRLRNAESTDPAAAVPRSSGGPQASRH